MDRNVRSMDPTVRPMDLLVLDTIHALIDTACKRVMGLKNTENGFNPCQIVKATIAGNSTLISGDMWVSKDTLLLMRKLPVALVQHPDYGQITAITTLNYSYTISAGWPWAVGGEWAYMVDVNSTTGQHYVLNNSVEVTEIEDISVPAGNFSCYRLEHSNQQGNITLIEWWNDDLGLFVDEYDVLGIG